MGILEDFRIFGISVLLVGGFWDSVGLGGPRRSFRKYLTCNAIERMVSSYTRAERNREREREWDRERVGQRERERERETPKSLSRCFLSKSVDFEVRCSHDLL